MRFEGSRGRHRWRVGHRRSQSVAARSGGRDVAALDLSVGAAQKGSRICRSGRYPCGRRTAPRSRGTREGRADLCRWRSWSTTPARLRCPRRRVKPLTKSGRPSRRKGHQTTARGARALNASGGWCCSVHLTEPLRHRAAGRGWLHARGCDRQHGLESAGSRAHGAPALLRRQGRRPRLTRATARR